VHALLKSSRAGNQILNTGFFKVFKTLEPFQKKGETWKAWIYRIMVNTAIDLPEVEMRHQHSDIEKSVYAEDSSDVNSD